MIVPILILAIPRLDMKVVSCEHKLREPQHISFKILMDDSVEIAKNIGYERRGRTRHIVKMG
jgi:hypothetical protein